MNITEILQTQREYFKTGETLSIAFRREMLKKLYTAVKENEQRIIEALNADLGKSDFEGFMCEIGTTLSEISFMLKNLKKLAKPKKVPTPMAQFKSKSYILPQPFGNVLIMSPWNYPFLLAIEPLVNAIAAGNTAVLKPSAYSPATSSLVKELIEACFHPKFVAVITGGRKENSELLNQKFDFVFFTGSQSVGKEVLRHTAETLTPAVLELGGKSPCIVDKTAKIQLTAKRIVFGKFLNCGQTCVAPDYILCHKSIKDELVAALCAEIKAQFGDNPLANPDYGKIVNEKHFDRILSLIQPEKIAIGGESDRQSLKIAPTVLNGSSLDDPAMQEEIFGPVLPILTFESKEEIINLLWDRQKPLALYVFSEDKAFINEITARIRYGGGCVNDTIIHLTSPHLPFGGVGESGMGAYHGEFGFNTFSHRKSILDKSTQLDMKMRYQPYDREKSLKTVRKYLK